MKLRGKLFAIGLVMIVFLFITSTARASWGNETGFGFSLGYKAYKLDGTEFSHDTHPDDWFLPRSGVPGSAGTTTLDGGMSHFAALGIRYDAPIATKLTLDIGLGGMVGGERDEHKNDNDGRADENGAFVYSQSKYGMYAELGLTYHLGDFRVGVVGEVGGIFTSHGWDRWGNDEAVSRKFEVIPTVGPKIGYQFSESLTAEGSVQFGQGGVSPRVSLIYRW